VKEHVAPVEGGLVACALLVAAPCAQGLAVYLALNGGQHGGEARSTVSQLAVGKGRERRGLLAGEQGIVAPGAMQAIIAVSLIRHLATSSDPQGFMCESEAWSRQIVSSTTTSALSEETAEKIRRRALEKVEQFFRGIALHKP
jgi:hypothetical protein